MKAFGLPWVEHKRADSSRRMAVAASPDSTAPKSHSLKCASPFPIYGYDNAGQLTSVTYAGQGSVTFAHDVAHRLTGITDAAGNSVTYTLANSGIRTKEEFKDPAGMLARSLSRAYDALNRAQSAMGGMR